MHMPIRFRPFVRLGLLTAAALGLFAVGCTEDGCTIRVAAGSDDHATIQGAFEMIQDGGVICISPGTYNLSDPVEIRGLTGVTVRGTGATASDVVLDFATQDVGSKGLTATSMTDFTIEHLTILDAPGDDLFITGSTGVTIRDVRAGWVTRPAAMRGKYAIYPVSSTDVLIEDSEAFGSSDAGIYVGQVTNCIVRNSRAYGNVAGIEIENSVNCEVYGNIAENNTGGILVFELPGLPMTGSGTLIHDNMIVDNNLANFAESGTIVSYLPQGTGMMILAANDVEIRGNTISGHGSVGILAISFTTAIEAGVPDPMDPTYDPYLDGLWIHDNTFTGNGMDPSPGPVAAVLGGCMISMLNDVVWDTVVNPMPIENPFCMTGGGTFQAADLPRFEMCSQDLAPYACSRTPRPETQL